MKNKLVSVVIVTKDRKKDLVECIDSYLNQAYQAIEIIVVDNASKPPLITWLPKKYPQVKLITLESNTGAAQGRNIGLETSRGHFILFTDDDAYADRDMVKHLVSVFEKNKKAGVAQPLVYDKQHETTLQGAGHKIDLTTGRVKAWGVGETDIDQYKVLQEVPLCGCVWMTRRSVFRKIGNYDEDYFIPYEDSDFSFRALKAGYKNYCYSKAKTWHQGPKTTFVHPWVEFLGITSPERAYRVARNKIIFMRKHSPFPQNILFFFIFLPGYIFVHSMIISATLRFDILARYWLGVLSGIWYAIVFPFKELIKRVRKKYEQLDLKLNPVKMYILAWTEPITWIIDKSAKSILDVGCGEGLPMQLIKTRMNPRKVVGVDLFEPYIREAKKKNIHDEYILTDVRALPFRNKSFDVVIALQVLEHLSKRNAWKVLEKMERIAKKQIIIATPIGEMYHPPVDENPYQMHKSSFTPEEFKRRGYKVLKVGRKEFLGETGIVHKVNNDLIKKLLFGLNLLLMPLFYLVQPLSNYHLYAYKRIEDD